MGVSEIYAFCLIKSKIICFRKNKKFSEISIMGFLRGATNSKVSKYATSLSSIELITLTIRWKHGIVIIRPKNILFDCHKDQSA